MTTYGSPETLSQSSHSLNRKNFQSVLFVLLFTQFSFILGMEFESLSFHKNYVKHISKSSLIQNP